jgi:hypothetical protein
VPVAGGETLMAAILEMRSDEASFDAIFSV